MKSKEKSVCFKFENVITYPITSYIKKKFNIIETSELDHKVKYIINEYYKNKWNIYLYTFKFSENHIRAMHKILNENNIPFLGIIDASRIPFHQDFLYKLMEMGITRLYTDSEKYKDIDTKSFNIDLRIVERPYNENLLKMHLSSKEKLRV